MDFGNLLIKPYPQAYNIFLWHLGTRLFLLLTSAFILFGWLTRIFLSFSLKDLYRRHASSKREIAVQAS